MGSVFEACDIVRRADLWTQRLLALTLLVCNLRSVHSGGPIALDLSGKHATQRATIDAASRAIDGNVRTACKTQANRHPWWKLDLGDQHWVGVITVTNKNVDGWRLQGAVTRAGLSPLYTENEQCGSPVTQAQASSGAVIEFRCNPLLLARYVYVVKDFSSHKNGDRYLHFAELTIMEYVDKCVGLEGDDAYFTLLCKGCMIANNEPLATKTARSPKECARACAEDAGCVAFDFAPKHGLCNLHASTDAGQILNIDFKTYTRSD